ncbi:hypothetical protein DU478_21905 [Thalassococcus profundi]|uniref:Uncharacterized protein n=1 Tax=Thalassococcus profundi TaxID=2282382 RepID=A0A369TFM2_9RHOB|nr:hypothetical protein [Thalassococcus profundi]RDD64123.1 hypothetical protein DU478_21905 [Thalassococcus profundi]
MKRTLITATVALATLAGAASAMTSSANQVILERYAPNIQTETLTSVQISQLMAIVNSGDSAGEKRAQIQHFVN